MEKHLIINIGRQFGSGGRRVADCLSQKLGIPVYDNELILTAAEKSGFSVDLFRKSDETKSFFRLDFYRNSISDEELFMIQSNVINELADEGSAIFVGRASNYILRDRNCLDVFLSAPLEWRVNEAMTRLGLSLEDVTKLVTKKDRSRQSWYDFFTLGSWGVASEYDLCLDSSILGDEGTADFIIEFARRRGLL